MAEIDELAARIHSISTEHGFDPPTLQNLPEKLMLSVSELSEAMEEHRSHSADNNALAYFIGDKPEGILVEIADSIIRNLHMMHSLMESEGMDLTPSEILTTKVEYNASRPFKHGRNY